MDVDVAYVIHIGSLWVARAVQLEFILPLPLPRTTA